MSATFNARILSAERPFYEGPCEYISVPATSGQYGVMANHSNGVLALIPGEMHFRVPGGDNQYAWISSGMIKIENNEVLILVDTAERPDEIDIKKAKREEAKAKEAILQKRSIQEFHAAQASLARAVSRQRVGNSYSSTRKRNPLI